MVKKILADNRLFLVKQHVTGSYPEMNQVTLHPRLNTSLPFSCSLFHSGFLNKNSICIYHIYYARTERQVERSRVRFPFGSTQPLKKMSTRDVSWGKNGRSVGLTTLPLSCADCIKILGVKLLGPYGHVQTCNGIALPCVLHRPPLHPPPFDCPNNTSWRVQITKFPIL